MGDAVVNTNNINNINNTKNNILNYPLCPIVPISYSLDRLFDRHFLPLIERPGGTLFTQSHIHC